MTTDPVPVSEERLSERSQQLAEVRNRPDSVAFLRNRAEDARNDAKIMKEREPDFDAGEYEYLEREFDRAADELSSRRSAEEKMREALTPLFLELVTTRADAARYVERALSSLSPSVRGGGEGEKEKS